MSASPSDVPRAEPDGRDVPQSNGPIPAAPSTRRLARELDVDLKQVRGSGPAGLVTAEDVRSHAGQKAGAPQSSTSESPEPPAGAAEGDEAGEERPEASPAASGPVALPDFARWGEVERVPLRSVRRATAIHMAQAWEQVPHVNHQDLVDVTELEQFRRQQADAIEAGGGHLTLTVFVLKALVAALKSHPRLNSSLDVASQEIVLKRYYHVGVAVDTERGLVVPVLRDVDRKSIAELASEVSALAARTRAGEISREELQGGTFTLTNIGVLGGTGFSPIVNFPQVAILGMGRARLQTSVLGDLDDYRIVPRLMMPLVLAFDHRVADGADAARFVNALKEMLESPSKLWLRI